MENRLSMTIMRKVVPFNTRKTLNDIIVQNKAASRSTLKGVNRLKSRAEVGFMVGMGAVLFVVIVASLFADYLMDKGVI